MPSCTRAARPFRGERIHRIDRNPHRGSTRLRSRGAGALSRLLPAHSPWAEVLLTVDDAVLCPDCVKDADAIRLSGGLTVEVGHDRLLVRRGSDVVEVLAGEVRHLVDALVEGAVRLVDRQNAIVTWPHHKRSTGGRLPDPRYTPPGRSGLPDSPCYVAPSRPSFEFANPHVQVCHSYSMPMCSGVKIRSVFSRYPLRARRLKQLPNTGNDMTKCPWCNRELVAYHCSQIHWSRRCYDPQGVLKHQQEVPTDKQSHYTS
jgi:hypothetical protein